MANKIPLKAIYSGSNTSALSELQSGDTIAVSYIDGLQAGLDAKLPLAGGTMTGNLNLGDNDYVNFGSSNDLTIHHDGTNSHINDAGTGNLNIRSSTDTYIRGANDEIAIWCNENGQVRLNYDNVNRLETTATGIDVSGTITADGLGMDDSQFIQLGNSDDLQIYHTGSHSYVRDNGVGDMRVLGTNLVLGNNADSQAYFYGIDGGSAKMYYGGSEKIATTNAGIDITGTTQTDSLTVQGAITEQETTKTASFTPNLATDGTIFDVSGTITVTMPAATAGKSFTIIDSGSGTLSWSGTIKWPSATVPAPSGSTIYSFISNGTNWYGMMAGTGFA